MPHQNPILLIEDDPDDQLILKKIFEEAGRTDQTIYFNNCEAALHFLKTTDSQPFIIISDINLPVHSGLEFKKAIDNDPQLREKSIPFLFLSTSVDHKTVKKAYTEMTVQGFFQKPDTYPELKSLIGLILDYWTICRHPNSR